MKEEHTPRTTILRLSYVFIAFVVVCLTLSIAHSGLVNAQQQNNNTIMQSQGTPSITTTTNAATNMNSIVLVHGRYVDGYSYCKRAIDLVGLPVILVGHFYGGFLLTNLFDINYLVNWVCQNILTKIKFIVTTG